MRWRSVKVEKECCCKNKTDGSFLISFVPGPYIRKPSLNSLSRCIPALKIVLLSHLTETSLLAVGTHVHASHPTNRSNKKRKIKKRSTTQKRSRKIRHGSEKCSQ